MSLEEHYTRKGDRPDYKALHTGEDDEVSFRRKSLALPNPAESAISGDDSGGTEGDDQYDLHEIQRMREEFSRLEEEEARLRRTQELETMRQKLAKKKSEVDLLRGEIRNSKDSSCHHPPLDSNPNLTLNDLRKDKALSKLVKASLKTQRIDCFSNSSESGAEEGCDSDSGSQHVPCKKVQKPKPSKKMVLPSSESDSDSVVESDLDKGKKGKKSGITVKASDRVRYRQNYPQAHLRFEFVNDSLSFETLPMNLFVAGELEIIAKSSIKDKERTARIALLKRLMYLNT